MKHFFISVVLIISVINLKAGCYAYAIIRINGLEFFDGGINSFHGQWIGNCYADSLNGGPYGLSIHIYFHPGDTVYLDNRIITQPGYYTTNFDENCENVFEWSYSNHFICAYLSDTLEEYYRHNLDHHFLDSLTAAQKALDDSLAAVQKALDDSLAAVQNAFDDSVAAVPAVFYPNPVADVITFECFKTVQAPFDFQAYDLQGRCILSRRIEFTESYQTQTIDMTSVEAGTYVVKYFLNGKPCTRQVIKL
ncbi:MAG: T9SS type A sorting domain-containing protein [Bacteroidetes bacterium]|nr:T9SS type A sorting domain-containing protein [Bacteroidota bacterium]